MLTGALATAAVLLGSGAHTASAHDRLAETTPADGGTVGTPPAQVILQFSRPPLPLGAQVLVSGPGGTQVSAGAAELRGTSVVQPLLDGLPAGSYTVGWRVTSADGHPLSGTAGFIVDGAGTPATGPVAGDAGAPTRAAADAGPAAPDAGGRPAPVAWTAVGALLLGAAVTVGRQLRRRP
ncbi:copper resistance protein CopC [Modestobacter lapidis]